MMKDFVKKHYIGALAGLLSFLNAGLAVADCAPKYREQAELIRDDRVHDLRGIGVVLLFSGASVSSIGAPVVGTPLIVVGLGKIVASQLVDARVFRSEMERTALVLEEARKGYGKSLRKFVRKVRRRAGDAILFESVREALLAAERENLFCRDDNFFSLRAIRRHVAEVLIPASAASATEDDMDPEDLETRESVRQALLK